MESESNKIYDIMKLQTVNKKDIDEELNKLNLETIKNKKRTKEYKDLEQKNSNDLLNM